MSGIRAPWYVENTSSVTAYCPWSGHDVTLRYLVCDGRPVTLLGCSKPDCTMACLTDAAPPDAAPPDAPGSADVAGDSPAASDS
jgi:hypothetical protein